MKLSDSAPQTREIQYVSILQWSLVFHWQVWFGLKTRIVALRNLSSFWVILPWVSEPWFLMFSISKKENVGVRSACQCQCQCSEIRIRNHRRKIFSSHLSPSHTLHPLHTPPRPTPSAPKPTNTALTSLPIRPPLRPAHINPRLPALP